MLQVYWNIRHCLFSYWCGDSWPLRWRGWECLLWFTYCCDDYFNNVISGTELCYYRGKVFKRILIKWKGTRRTAFKHLLINNYRFINEFAMVLFLRALWCQVIFHSASPLWEEITTQIFIFLKWFRTSDLLSLLYYQCLTWPI